MELSLFLARAWGLFTFLLCVGLLINKKSFIALFKKMQYDIGTILAGTFALTLGVMQVVVFNDWSVSWRGLITLFGWVSLIKGVLILFAPGYLEGFVKVVVKENWYSVSLVVGLLLGAYLLSVGYMHN